MQRAQARPDEASRRPCEAGWGISSFSSSEFSLVNDEIHEVVRKTFGNVQISTFKKSEESSSRITHESRR